MILNKLDNKIGWEISFGGCFMVVTEPKSWGVQGYCSSSGQGSLAYYLCPFAAMELIGRAEWVDKSDVESAEEQGESPVTSANSASPQRSKQRSGLVARTVRRNSGRSGTNYRRRKCR